MNLSQTLADSTYPALKQYVLEHTGLDYYASRDEDFATRVGRRLAAPAGVTGPGRDRDGKSYYL